MGWCSPQQRRAPALSMPQVASCVTSTEAQLRRRADPLRGGLERLGPAGARRRPGRRPTPERVVGPGGAGVLVRDGDARPVRYRSRPRRARGGPRCCPSPSCPESLFPQHHSEPFVRTPQVLEVARVDRLPGGAADPPRGVAAGRARRRRAGRTGWRPSTTASRRRAPRRCRPRWRRPSSSRCRERCASGSAGSPRRPGRRRPGRTRRHPSTTARHRDRTPQEWQEPGGDRRPRATRRATGAGSRPGPGRPSWP